MEIEPNWLELIEVLNPQYEMNPWRLTEDESAITDGQGNYVTLPAATDA
jgi:hypothetical protein